MSAISSGLSLSLKEKLVKPTGFFYLLFHLLPSDSSGIQENMHAVARREGEKLIADNRKARHDYRLFDTYEAGIVLLGTEVKAIREGRVNLRDSYGRIEQGEVFLYNLHISSYSHRGYADHEPLRRRKLLLQKREIRKLIGKVVERGMTLVPVRMYFKRGLVKVTVSLAKGKREYDKRETLRRREADREARATLKQQ